MSLTPNIQRVPNRRNSLTSAMENPSFTMGTGCLFLAFPDRNNPVQHLYREKGKHIDYLLLGI